MTHQFRCPLCGMNRNSNYDPSDWERDVELVQMTGLGRGMGFSKEIIGYIDDDPELKEKLLKRAQEIVEFLSEE